MNPVTSKSQPTTTSSAFRSGGGGGSSKSNSRASNDSNPFLETPARKLFKHHHHDSSQPPAAAPTSLSVPFGRGLSRGTGLGAGTGTGDGLEGVQSSSSSISTSRKPQRLVLTRVLPSNVVSTTAPSSSSSSSSTSASSATVTALGSRSSSAAVAAGGSGALSSASSNEASYPNTTSASTPFPTARPTITTATTATTATTPYVKDSHGFVIPFTPATRPSEQKQALQYQYQQQRPEQHPSTTPKAPPNRHYLDLLAKSLESGPAPKLNLGILSTEEHQEPQRTQVQEREQQQEQEPAEIVPPVNSAMMALARKSIMQHSTAAPASIFRKLSNNKAGGPQLLSRSVINNGAASNGGVPQAPATTKAPPATTKTAAGATAIATKAVLPHSRTAAVESPVVESVVKESGGRWEPPGDLAFTFMSAPKPTTAPVTTNAATTTAKPDATGASAPLRVFARSILDLSGSNEPKIQRNFALNTITTATSTNATTNTNISNHNNSNVTKPIYHNKAYQPPSMTATLMNISSAAESRNPPTATATATTTIEAMATEVDADVEMGSAGVEGTGGSQQTSLAFDIRAALRMDAARTQYQLPTLIASLSPPPSPRRRPTPYSVPSANDREALRIRRMPRFKARPLNPNLFTGAGDQGLPKIQKPALTVPVSPVFSQRRRTKDAVVEAGGLAKGGGIAASLAATRLKEMVEAGVAEKQRKRQEKQSEQLQGGKRQVYSAGGAGVGNAGRQQTGGRIVSAARPFHAGVPRRGVDISNKDNKDLRGIGGGARRIEIGGAGVGAASGGGGGGGGGGRGTTTTTTTTTTRPVPFNFATTELQRKRMLYQPTSSDYALIASTASSSSLGVRHGSRSGSLNGGANGLSLEDLMPDA